MLNRFIKMILSFLLFLIFSTVNPTIKTEYPNGPHESPLHSVEIKPVNGPENHTWFGLNDIPGTEPDKKTAIKNLFNVLSNGWAVIFRNMNLCPGKNYAFADSAFLINRSEYICSAYMTHSNEADRKHFAVRRPVYSGMFCFADAADGQLRYFYLNLKPNEQEQEMILNMIKTAQLTESQLKNLISFYTNPSNVFHRRWNQKPEQNLEFAKACEDAYSAVVAGQPPKSDESVSAITPPLRLLANTDDTAGVKPTIPVEAQQSSGGPTSLDVQIAPALVNTGDTAGVEKVIPVIQQFSGEPTASLEVASSSVSGVSAQTNSTVADNTAACCVIA